MSSVVKGQQEMQDLEAAARSLVSDLHEPRALVFWTDAVGSAAVGWSAFILALTTEPFSPLMFLSLGVAALALYRGLCFIHELTHLRRKALPGFETAWNLLFGTPLLLPSFTYVGVHQSHHNLSSYGTKEDPEYLPFAGSRRLMIGFALQSTLVLPALLFIRFLILSPVALCWPRFHRWLEVHASAFAMNPEYQREVTPAMHQKVRRWEIAMLLFWALLLSAVFAGTIPARIIPLWYATLALISFLNTARVLGAHEYESDGAPRSRQGQLRDSIDTPGGPWTELWAPVGLRFHALHHYFPGIPYHNLPQAYRRLVTGLPLDASYLESTSPSLARSLRALYAKGAKAK
jgi:fatty acid desaturase